MVTAAALRAARMRPRSRHLLVLRTRLLMGNCRARSRHVRRLRVADRRGLGAAHRLTLRRGCMPALELMFAGDRSFTHHVLAIGGLLTRCLRLGARVLLATP